jgi:hypothetical protein
LRPRAIRVRTVERCVAGGFDIGGRLAQAGRAVLELADGEIAWAAKEPAHLAGGMAVIDAQGAGGLLAADRAEAALLRQHEVEIPQRHAVDALELRPPMPFRTIGALPGRPPGIVRPSQRSLNVDLVPMGRVALALVGAHARAVVGALRTLPSLCETLACGH